MENENSPSHVAFHFDVMCPWAYQTSIWMREVRDRLNIEVDWCFFSLEERGTFAPFRFEFNDAAKCHQTFSHFAVISSSV